MDKYFAKDLEQIREEKTKEIKSAEPRKTRLQR